MHRDAVHGGAIERGVVDEDRALEILVALAGLEAELVEQHPPTCGQDLERLRLTTAAVEREGEPFAGALSHRVLGAQLPQRRHRVLVSSEGQLGVEIVLGALESQLLEAIRLGRSEPFVGDIDKRRSAPERQRPSGQGDGQLGVAVHQGSPPVVAHALEASGVEARRCDADPVAGRDGLDRVCAQRRAELRHVDLHELLRRVRDIVAPEGVDEVVGGHHLVRAQQQHQEQRLHLRRGENDVDSVAPHLQRPQDPVLEHPPIFVRLPDRRDLYRS